MHTTQVSTYNSLFLIDAHHTSQHIQYLISYCCTPHRSAHTIPYFLLLHTTQVSTYNSLFLIVAHHTSQHIQYLISYCCTPHRSAHTIAYFLLLHTTQVSTYNSLFLIVAHHTGQHIHYRIVVLLQEPAKDQLYTASFKVLATVAQENSGTNKTEQMLFYTIIV